MLKGGILLVQHNFCLQAIFPWFLRKQLWVEIVQIFIKSMSFWLKTVQSLNLYIVLWAIVSFPAGAEPFLHHRTQKQLKQEIVGVVFGNRRVIFTKWSLWVVLEIRLSGSSTNPFTITQATCCSLPNALFSGGQPVQRTLVATSPLIMKPECKHS